MIDENGKLRIEQSIVDQIDSVPHLEALLLIWNTRPNTWSADSMARSLYIRTEAAARILESLAKRDLIAAVPDTPDSYSYISDSEDTNKLLADVDVIYRKEVVRISSIIHSKASAGVRDFARAFRFTKEKE